MSENTILPPEPPCENIDKVLKNIEIKTQNLIVDNLQKGTMLNPSTFINKNNIGENKNRTALQASMDMLSGIMQSGADEFEKKVGRPMTYSEMRAAYG